MLKRHLRPWPRLFLAVGAIGQFQLAWQKLPLDWHSDRPLRVLVLVILGGLFLYMAVTGKSAGPWERKTGRRA